MSLLSDNIYSPTGYCLALHEIDMLREINLGNIDYALAWQYGQYYQTPWKDSPAMVATFLANHKDLLTNFLKMKVGNVVLDLIDSLDAIRDRKFRPVQVHPATRDMFHAVFSEMNRLIDVNRFDSILIKKTKDNYGPGSASLPEMEQLFNLDTVMRYTWSHGLLSQNAYYGNTDNVPVDAMDNPDCKMCLCGLKKLVERMKDGKDPVWCDLRIIACILSIFYRTRWFVYDYTGYPETLYKHADYGCGKLLSLAEGKVNKLSGWSIESALIQDDMCLRQWTHSKVGTNGMGKIHTHPKSLVARYLALTLRLRHPGTESDFVATPVD